VTTNLSATGVSNSGKLCQCGHLRVLHIAVGADYRSCRARGCECDQFVGPGDLVTVRRDDLAWLAELAMGTAASASWAVTEADAEIMQRLRTAITEVS
jgi:hypothetical protein